MENTKLQVFSIFAELDNGYSEVSINTELWQLITGNDEQVKLPIVTKGKDKAGNTVREFLIQDTKIYVRYNGKDAKWPNTLLMKTEDAKRLHVDTGVAYEF